MLLKQLSKGVKRGMEQKESARLRGVMIKVRGGHLDPIHADLIVNKLNLIQL